MLRPKSIYLHILCITNYAYHFYSLALEISLIRNKSITGCNTLDMQCDSVTDHRVIDILLQLVLVPWK